MAGYCAFLEYLAVHKAMAVTIIEANRKEANRLKQEKYIERRRIENPYQYRRSLPNAKSLPLLGSRPIELTPRRLNMGAIKAMDSKRKKETVFSNAPEV